MKKLAFFVILAATLSSCYIYEEDVRPRYDHRDRFTGYFEVEEYSKTYREVVYYNMYISRSGYDGDEVTLRDFYAEGTHFVAYISGDRIDIPRQVSNGYEVQGSGYVSAGKLYLNYRAFDLYGDSFVNYCEATAFR